LERLKKAPGRFERRRRNSKGARGQELRSIEQGEEVGSERSFDCWSVVPVGRNYWGERERLQARLGSPVGLIDSGRPTAGGGSAIPVGSRIWPGGKKKEAAEEEKNPTQAKVT